MIMAEAGNVQGFGDGRQQTVFMRMVMIVIAMLMIVMVIMVVVRMLMPIVGMRGRFGHGD